MIQIFLNKTIFIRTTCFKTKVNKTQMLVVIKNIFVSKHVLESSAHPFLFNCSKKRFQRFQTTKEFRVRTILIVVFTYPSRDPRVDGWEEDILHDLWPFWLKPQAQSLQHRHFLPPALSL